MRFTGLDLIIMFIYFVVFMVAIYIVERLLKHKKVTEIEMAKGKLKLVVAFLFVSIILAIILYMLKNKGIAVTNCSIISLLFYPIFASLGGINYKMRAEKEEKEKLEKQEKENQIIAAEREKYNLDKLLEYKKLLDAGVITQEEFERKKKELL